MDRAAGSGEADVLPGDPITHDRATAHSLRGAGTNPSLSAREWIAPRDRIAPADRSSSSAMSRAGCPSS